jgi:hypothetical protein
MIKIKSLQDMMPCLLVICCYLRNGGNQLQTKHFVHILLYRRLLLLHLADINLEV